MSILFTTPRLQRTLSVVYRFYDAFLFPVPVLAHSRITRPPASKALTLSLIRSAETMEAEPIQRPSAFPSAA